MNILTPYQALLLIRDNGPARRIEGICGNVEDLIVDRQGRSTKSWIAASHALSAIRAASQIWPHYSGNSFYPVPDPDKSGPEAAGAIYDKWGILEKSMWNKRTKYGRLRLDLLDHLVAYFEELP